MLILLQRLSSPAKYVFHTLVAYWKVVAVLAAINIVEIYYHIKDYKITRPSANLDPPFYTGCQTPILNTTARANATMMMLARNSDAGGAVASVKSIQEQFNDNFHYPWVFLNDEHFSGEFMKEVTSAVGGNAEVSFHSISKDMWGFPEWIDQERAQKAMHGMESRKIYNAGKESYHHMCRFQSGFFYDHPALTSYKWYWRVEPDIQLTCAITYDPFVSMDLNNKVYGYTIALWELGKTVPSLFRKLSDYKLRKHIPTTTIWTAMVDPSWAPLPIRRFILPWLRNRDARGNLWNMCHFWSNFEIADMDFFRSREYRELFQLLDQDGGFYYERWGDAPVHSLAAAMLLKAEQLHHFSDVGYVHSSLQYCAYESKRDAFERGRLVPGSKEERGEMLGCNCKCDEGIEIIGSTCFNRIRSTVM